MSSSKIDKMKQLVPLTFRGIISIGDKAPSFGFKVLETRLMAAHVLSNAIAIASLRFEATPEERTKQIQALFREFEGGVDIPFGVVLVGVSPMDANTGVDNVILVPSAVQVIATTRGQNYEDAVNELSDTATMIASFILKKLNIGPPGSSGIIVEV